MKIIEKKMALVIWTQNYDLYIEIVWLFILYLLPICVIEMILKQSYALYLLRKYDRIKQFFQTC